MCYIFRLTKWDDYFTVTFNHFWSECTGGNSENWLESKIKPPYPRLIKFSLSKSMTHSLDSKDNRIYSYLQSVDQGFRLNLGKSREMIMFVSLLVTFNMSINFLGGLVFTRYWLKPKTNHQAWPKPLNTV